jgi:hypothetical protein
MREDAVGLFWDDTPAPRLTAPPQPKREPPPRTWEQPDYLPGLAEARAWVPPLFTDAELEAERLHRVPLFFDIEIFKNYFLASFLSLESGKLVIIELFPGGVINPKLLWMLQNFLIIGFNSDFFDIPIATLAINGASCEALKDATNEIIILQVQPWMMLRQKKIKPLKINHIDIIEVCPLHASLKIYGGRLHSPKMQELPFHHETILTDDQICIVRHYNYNDLLNTKLVFGEVRQQIELRTQMSLMYGVDLRSKSDAQIAEAVINHELTRVNGKKPQRPEIPPGTAFAYKVPSYVRYETQVLQDALAIVTQASFIIGESGAPAMPEEVAALQIRLGNGVYQMGIGGLHSNETCSTHFAGEGIALIDRDVSSYYPAIILNQGLYPQHLGIGFLQVYKTLVERRLLAKKNKNKIEADTLKIVVNGLFGKLGSKWSTVFAPDLMVQVTITGQLALLMLVERLELAGIPVISANTDGVVVKCPQIQQGTYAAVVAQWEKDTGFNTEETKYVGIFSRDVNNYIAVKEDLKIKVKGVYAEKGSAGDSVLSKNPTNLICNDAVIAFLTKGVPIQETIRACRNLSRFISVRTVKGGAVKAGEYLGKAIRWYYATGCDGEIIYAETGNKVAMTDGAKPCMELPQEFPSDVDFEWYEREAFSILKEIGYPVGV